MIGRTLGRYRIAEKIGAGGMGEVYRAHDEQLDRDVALKVLPAGTLADEAARKQFRKEALALARLNHPNIETVHDFGNQEGRDFLVMELISGSSLSEKLRGGPLAEKEVLRLGIQFAEGLAAAHERGVVHRDLKPANLFVTPDGRLKILDFGLANLLRPELASDVTQSITGDTTTISGTVPYMPPEQLRGEMTDARSDIYSAGAVLYEMAAGRRPFPQTQGPQLMVAILREAPAPLRAVNPRLPPPLETVILKALEKEAGRRYQSAAELRAALEGVTAGAVPAVAASRWPIAATVSAALAVVLLLGLNVGRLRDRLLPRGRLEKEGVSPLAAPIKARRSIAVLGFKNLSGHPDEAWLSTALSEMLTTELAAGEQLRTIPGENVARIKIDLSLPDANGYARATVARIRENLGADYVVLGSYFGLGKDSAGKVRLDLRVQDTASGDLVASVTGIGTERELPELAARTGVQLREKLGVGEVSAADASTVRASLPANPKAARLYAEGLAKLRLFDALAARDLLEKAVAVEPNYALAHSALSETWLKLGYDGKAKEEAKKAFHLSANLSREDRLFIEGRYREVSREWDRAIEIDRTLFSFFPDNLEYGLGLAADQISAGRGKDARATVEELRKLPSPAREDPRVDLAESRMAHLLGDQKKEEQSAAKAVAKGKALGARLVLARGEVQQCVALLDLGETNSAAARCEEGKKDFAAAGDRSGTAWATNNIALGLWQKGDLAGAESAYREALALYREVGNKLGIATVLSNTAGVLTDRGDLAGAAKILEQSVPIYRELGAEKDTAIELGNLGEVLARRGELARSRRVLQEALAISRNIGAKDSLAYESNSLGVTLYHQGDLGAAKKALGEALMLSREIGLKNGIGYSLSGLGDILKAEGNPGAARKNFEEALSIRNELGEKGNAAADRVALAELSIEEGHAAEAEAPLRAALEEFRRDKLGNDEIAARSVLAQDLLAQDKLPEARMQIEQAGSLVAQSQDRGLRLRHAIVAARVRAASGKPAEAVKDLGATLAEARNYGFVAYQLGASLALGEIELQSGKTAAGRARLATLESAATAKGFLLIARKARAARK